MGTCTFTQASFPVPPFLLSARKRSGGKIKTLVGNIVGSASYATGGDNVRPGDLKGLSGIHHLWFLDGGFDIVGTRYGVLVKTTAGAEKLKVFNAFGTEETAAVDLSAKQWRVVIMGVG